MTFNDRKRLLRAITNYVNASINESWKGGGDPADIPEIDERLKIRKEQMMKVIDSIESVPKCAS